jgi:hypothetical protein
MDDVHTLVLGLSRLHWSTVDDPGPGDCCPAGGWGLGAS